jgi:hypothetical protein
MKPKFRRLYARGITCLRKKRFPDLAAAEGALQGMVTSDTITPLEKTQLETYRCPACKGWHIGKRWNRTA